MRWITIPIFSLVFLLAISLGFLSYCLPPELKDIPQGNISLWERLYSCLNIHHGYLYALLVLFFLWILVRVYYYEQNARKVKISPEDLGLLKIIKSNASLLLDKYQHDRKVVNLKDWRDSP